MVQAVWAWLQLSLASSLMEYHTSEKSAALQQHSTAAASQSGEAFHPPQQQSRADAEPATENEVDFGRRPAGDADSPISEASEKLVLHSRGAAAAEQSGRAGQRVDAASHVVGLMEAMQFWSLFDVLLEAGQLRLVAAMLLRSYRCLRAASAIR